VHRRFLLVVTLVLFALTLLLAPAASAQADLDCADFNTQQEAQAELNRDPSDPHGLDADNDGIACEHLPSGAQQGQYSNETTTQQTVGETTTADDVIADATIEDASSPDSENFQCEFFLRVVRDDRGALRAQYRDDELIVERFEQCLSADVLASTIPDRKLPFTGGPPVLFIPWLVALAAAGIVLARRA
jgi:hypothetical protein